MDKLGLTLSESLGHDQLENTSVNSQYQLDYAIAASLNTLISGPRCFVDTVFQFDVWVHGLKESEEMAGVRSTSLGSLSPGCPSVIRILNAEKQGIFYSELRPHHWGLKNHEEQNIYHVLNQDPDAEDSKTLDDVPGQ